MTILDTFRQWFDRSGRSTTNQNANRPTRSSPAGDEQVEVVDLGSAFDAYQAGARFIDVREPNEWAEGHIAGAVHHPVDALETHPEVSVARDTPVVTYCAAGLRAARGAAALAANGYSNVKALQSGYADWHAAGYPVEHPDADQAG